jgi:hypothetical protein
MVDASETERAETALDVKAEIDERRIARAVSIGLPFATVATALVVGTIIGPALAILVLAAGMILGVIALFWASLRVLSGDAPLSPELEALDAKAHAVDALSSRKRMLVRALKDLDNERALGKLDAEDYEQLATVARGELREVLRRVDASLDPHRSQAEDAARAYLQKRLGDATDEPAPVVAAPSEPESLDDAEDSDPSLATARVKPEVEAKARVSCSACATSNEVDAAFCKKCGGALNGDALPAKAATTTAENADET